MEILKKKELNSLGLVLGLVLLLVPAIVILMGLQKIRDVTEVRAQLLALQNDFGDYGSFLKDDVLRSALRVPVQTYDGVPDLDDRIVRLEKSLDERARPYPELSELFHRALKLRSEIAENASAKDLVKTNIEIESILAKIDERLQGRVDSQFTNLNSEIQNATAVCLIALLLALILIGYAVFLYRKNDVNLRLYAAELKKEKEKAEHSESLKTKFLSTVSHEIRTPLNGIIGLSDSIMRSPENEGNLRLIGTIHQSGRTLLRIVNDILDFSKIESGNLILESSRFSVKDVIDQVDISLRPIALAKRLSLHCEIDENVASRVVGDPTRLSQLLYNFVGNAIKFTEVGSVILRCRKESGIDGYRLLFSIQDTGIGISAKDLRNLFVPFYQVNSGGTSGEAGTGLGLAISKRIIESMGGNISVTSEVGHGSRFIFLIPFADPSKSSISDTLTDPQEVHAISTMLDLVRDSDGLSPRILVVDDNPTNQIVAQAMLSQMGVTTISVSGGREAVAACRQNVFDIVLMDLQMPEMSGHEAAKEIRQLGITTPILALTAKADQSEESECFESGMDGFVTKPMTLEDLRRAIEPFILVDRAVDLAITATLESKIGRSACRKVIASYVKALTDLTAELPLAIEEKDISTLHRFGHKFASSSAAVGATKLSALFLDLEKTDGMKNAQSVAAPLMSLIRRTRKVLTCYSEASRT